MYKNLKEIINLPSRVTVHSFDGDLIGSGETITAADYINSSGKDGTPSNDNGKVVKLENAGDEDAKISQEFLPRYHIDLLTSRFEIAGDTSPVPVYVNGDGDLVPSKTDDADSALFHGFVARANNGVEETGTKTTSTSSTFSHTVPAGTARTIIVIPTGYGSTTQPTGVTFDGDALTKADGDGGSGSSINASIWYKHLGDSASPTTANVVITGSTVSYAEAFTLEYVDQTNGIQATDTNVSDSGTSVSFTPNKAGSYILYAGLLATDGTVPSLTNATTDTGVTEIGTSDRFYVRGHELSYNDTAESATYKYSTSSGQGVFIGVEVFGYQTSSVPLISGGFLDGFSGLTVGATYYAQDTAGTIGTSAGSTSVRVGKAVSATKLLVVH